MSASKEKKNRQELASSGWTDPKTAREAQQRKAERKSDILYAVVGIAFVAVAVVTMVWKSGVVQQKATAATVNGEKYSASEVQYYFHSVYQDFMSQFSYYASALGLDTSKSLRSQECSIDENSETWFDYFAAKALDQMADIRAICDKADSDGFTWNDDMQATFDANMDTLKESAKTANVSLKNYLKRLYGSVMTQSAYEKHLKLTIQAQAYVANFMDSLTYSDSELESAYSEARNSYDLVNYECIRISGTAQSTKDADGNTVEATDEEKAQALEYAKDLANSFYESYEAGESLSKLADSDDKASYTDGKNTAYYDSVLLNWLFDDSRKDGDSAVLADEDNSAYYVAVFGERFRPEFNVQDVRHILIQPESGEKKEGDEGYEEEQAQLKADAKARAEELLNQYLAGDATEDAFAALAQENSADTGSAVNGGLISEVSEISSYVEPFRNWATASHQPGDTGIVESDYGYHIMYYVGNAEPYWKSKVSSSLQNNDYTAWYEEVTKDAAAEQSGSGMKYVG